MNNESALLSEPIADSASFVNIAAYLFVPIDDPGSLRRPWKKLCDELQIKGTILVSREGINLFLAGTRSSIDTFLTGLRSDPRFARIEVKESFSSQQPFNRMLVKLKREIISFGQPGIDPGQRTSPKLPARELKQWLSEGRKVRLLDTRNDYEVDLGTFDGAIKLPLRSFRDFPEAIKQLPESAKDEPLVMFCTGGIRCEKAGPFMEQQGYRQVYQLEGGILKYFEECGGAHYHGDCFVFDGRVALNPDLEPSGAVQCFRCQAVLTHEDIQSDQFRFGVSCPHCYRTPEQARHDELSDRQNKLNEVAAAQAGCTPYDNRRLIHVPRRDAGRTLIDFLCEYHPPTPRDLWMRWVEDGSLTSHGEAVQVGLVVRDGMQFEHLERGVTEPSTATRIEIVHQDSALIVVNKPAPLPVHPSGRFNRNTLLSFLSEVYRPEKLRTAHRLDSDTTGLVIFCRNFASARIVQPQFTNREVQKEYLLRVHGNPESDAMTCIAPISDRADRSGLRQVDPEGRMAETRFRLLSRMPDGTSLMIAEPITGRTNQIRVHAAALGLPIVGDRLYGKPDDNGSVLCLHAWRLGFRHPTSGEFNTFESTMPEWAIVT